MPVPRFHPPVPRRKKSGGIQVLNYIHFKFWLRYGQWKFSKSSRAHALPLWGKITVQMTPWDYNIFLP